MVPVPAEAMTILPARVLASATKSFSVFAGRLGFTTSTIGTYDSSAIEEKSFSGSYGILLYSEGATVSVPLEASTSE